MSRPSPNIRSRTPFSWRGARVLITAGPTREYLDPVRYLSNASSGAMGVALAQEALKRGARVTVVHGPMSAPIPQGVKAFPVVSAADMFRQVKRLYKEQDCILAAAAVADYRPERFQSDKIKKGAGAFSLRLRLNPDILGWLGQQSSQNKPRLVGFALETRQLLSRAKEKMRAKHVDAILANTPGNIDSQRASAHLLGPGETKSRFSGGTKPELAEWLMEELQRWWSKHL